MGQLEHVEGDGAMERFLNQYDILAFSHIGDIDISFHTPCISNAFAPVALACRPHKPSAGGVAIYAKTWLTPYITLVKVRPEYGMIWIKVHDIVSDKSPLFVACVYIPHEGSTYYKGVHGIDLATHFETLMQDVMSFQAQGVVIMTGDFNGRIGQAQQWDNDIDERTWCCLSPSGVQLVHHHFLAPDRGSRDDVINNVGKHIIDLYRSCDLCVMNGRVPGDIDGAYMFEQLGLVSGQSRQSVIDYFMASAPLFLYDDGTCKQGFMMKVIDFQGCPMRGSGNRYDHRPITLVIPAECIPLRAVVDMKSNNERHETTSRGVGCDGAPDVALRWNPAWLRQYVDIIETDGTVMTMLNACQSQACDASESEHMLTRAVWHAASLLHAKCGGVIRRAGRACNAEDNVGFTQNAWYSDACRTLRHRLKLAEWSGICDEGYTVQRLRAEYRSQVKKDKAAYYLRRHEEVMQNLYYSPKKFWKWFQGSGKSAVIDDVDAWTNYFDKLLRANGQAQYFGGTLEEHCHKFSDIFGSACQDRRNKAACLNRPIVKGEVVEALERMGIGKATGIDNMPAEFLRSAMREERFIGDDGKPRVVRQYLLADALTSLFNKVLTGTYPTHWSIGAIAPVPKPKGDANVMDDYRGITVGSAISKLYALVIMQRMDAWAEINGYRASTQFGFRRDMGTTHGVFMLRHIIDKYASAKKPVFTAFIDFRKAYDRVDRNLLWRCLERLGMHGDCLKSLKEMYADVQVQVRVNGKRGHAFTSDVGVKQGDPLSPLLFGLFIDRCAEFIDTRCLGVQVGGQRVKVMLYADDLVIVAESKDDLQSALHALGDFCEATSMKVNVDKSEVVVFNRRFWTCGQQVRGRWIYQEVHLPVSDSFVYLGVKFSDAPFTLKDAKARGLSKARGALFAMMQRCHSIKLFNPHILGRLFDALVLPVLSYGSEMWGPDVLIKQKDLGLKGDHEDLHRCFMRMALWVNKATPIPCMMTDLGRQPVMLAWVSNIFRFWNSIVNLGQQHILYQVLCDNINIVGGWAQQVMSLMHRIDSHYDAICVSHEGMPLTIDHVRTYVDGFGDKWRATLWAEANNAEVVATNTCARGSIVRACPDDTRAGFKVMKYKRWFMFDCTRHNDASFGSCFYGMVFRSAHVRTLSAFRYGMHWLNSEVGRTLGVGRSSRTCPCCSHHEREDELHVFMCPVYDHIKPYFPLVFGHNMAALMECVATGSMDVDGAMNLCMNGHGALFWEQLANFLIQTRKIRSEILLNVSVVR